MSDSAAARPLRDAGDEAIERLSHDVRGRLWLVPGGRPVGPEPHARRLSRVLIVDDNRDAREMYALFFQKHGYDAFIAEEAPIAIEMAIRLKPDVIVMDLAMPGMSGVSATHHIKGDPRTRKIPVILLTGHPTKAIEQGALEMGVDVFLTKPCLPEDLEGHVRRLIENRKR